MITPELSQRSQELAVAREPFVTATVVRVQHPASVQPGSVALVLADGTIEGFVGGVCAEQSVKAHSLAALEKREPVLLRILPDPEQGAAAAEAISTEEGVVTVRNPCLSGGAIEIFLEPAAPPPRVLVVGETPIAGALARIGGELGLEMVSLAAGDPELPGDELALIVAAHGRDELHALRRGLESGVAYVGLVASHKRGRGVLDELRADGVAEELLERIDVPAGIPIGSHTTGEIAISILAKVVSIRRGSPGGEGERSSHHASAAPARDATSAPKEEAQSARPPSSLAIDPICGMTVAAVESTPSVRHNGETVYFCCESCKAKFEAQGEHASLVR